MGELVRHEPANSGLAAMTTDQLKYIANTDFVPRALRGNMPAILACIATGRALGLADMDALRSINIIDGKATMSAELMVKLARREGHSITFELGDGEVVAHGKRGDNGDEASVKWTIKMAERAGLISKDNWKRHPETMLTWRAMAQLCRFLFPDVLGGVSYTPEEAEWTPEERVNESIQATVPVDTEVPDDTPALAAGEQLGDAATGRSPAASAEVEENEQTSFAERIPAAARRRR
jgi:hypothetical protein